MGQKRKAGESRDDFRPRAPKKTRHVGGAREREGLIFEPRPDWHAAELPPLEVAEVKKQPPPRAIEELHKYADSLLEDESAAYDASHKAGSSSHKFLSTIMSSGTLEDKVSALTLLVQESPIHAKRAFENLLGLSKKKSRNQALMALAALKDLLGQGVVLPGDRKLRAFSKQPALLSALQGGLSGWRSGDALPGAVQKVHLLVWAYEDWLKKAYFDMLQTLESWLGDEVDYSRTRAITYVWELLRDKPEQEENLLRLLVNKLGDTSKKVASRASYLLLQLETTHPAMKTIITNSIEADCLFKPGQSVHARYYAIVTLNQTIIGPKEQDVANKLLDVYFSLFLQLWKPADKAKKALQPDKAQGGGGKPGKMARKKQREAERVDESADQLRDKMIAQVLAGVNRAFPFADTSDPTFEKQLDNIFRVTHSANFNTAVQALMLIQQISSAKHYGAERYYRTLYESLLDPRLLTSSKQVMYLNLLYKSLKQDLNAKRVQAFVKRLVQTITMHEPAFICGVLYLIHELERSFPSIRNMLTEAEETGDDGEEHFVDAPEEGEQASSQPAEQRAHQSTDAYDPRKRDPEHAHADRSCLWELLPFLQHFHPSVSLFAEALLSRSPMPPKPDAATHTLMHFLDRFVYRSARTRASAAQHGSSIMQPAAGSNAADRLFRPGRDATAASAPADQLNTEQFWLRRAADVAPDDVFFHSYFSRAGFAKRAKKTSKRAAAGSDDDESDGDGADDGEDEIWKAITASRPEVDGPAEDSDDISLGDLEEAYSDSDDGSEAGIDLGGDGADVSDGEEGGLVLDDGSDGDDMDDMLDLESGEDDALFDSDDEMPVAAAQAAGEDDAELSKSQQKRKERKKFKSLPTFASADDYAKLLGGDDDDEE